MKNVYTNKTPIVAERVALLRGKKGVEQAELAEYLNENTDTDITITRSSVSHWECGRRRVPPRYLPALCSFFGVTEEYLLGLTDDPSSKKPTDKDKSNSNEQVKHEINSSKLYAYDKQPLFVEFLNYEHPDEWALYDGKFKRFIFTNDTIKQQTILGLNTKFYSLNPHLETDLYRNKKKMDMSTLLRAESVVVEMITGNEAICGQYNGRYRHNETHTCLINAEGLTLPYEGLGVSYYAYQYKM